MVHDTRFGGIRPDVPTKPTPEQLDRIADAMRLGNEINRLRKANTDLRKENRGLARALVLCAAAVSNDAELSVLAPAELTPANVSAVLRNDAALHAADEFAVRSGIQTGRVRKIIGIAGARTGQNREGHTDPGR